MTSDHLESYISAYRDGLLKDVLPFWLRHGLDPDHGGVWTCLGQDGSVIDRDKVVWAQGRFAWLLATLYNTVEKRSEWLEAALSCLDFLKLHGFDQDGKMFFLLTTDGKPLRKRRYAFSEAFACMAYSACAKATGDPELKRQALHLFHQFNRFVWHADAETAKVDPNTRPSKSLAPIMTCLHLAQILRENLGFEQSDSWVDRCILEIRRNFCKPELKAVMEVVATDGSLLDHFEGRTLNPGHAIEAAWFILHEAKHRGDDGPIRELGVQMLDWMWDRGWDETYGGLFYFRDLHDGPVAEYWHDMKFWWPHNEAVIANLLAYLLTGEDRFAVRHAMVHAWAYRNFADPKFGEWFGYLHRDGTLSVNLKGNHWKGPFHLPRMQWYCWKLIEEEID